MKKALSFFMVVCLSFCCIYTAGADSINLSLIEKRATFSYDESKNTTWTYYQYAEKYLADGTCVEILAVDWGNNTEASAYPEFRIFVTTKENVDIIVQSATIMLDGNMFELTFNELKLDSSHGACFYWTSDAVSFMKSLATAKSFSAVLRYKGETISLIFTADEIAPISQFAYDLLNLDFLNHIVSSELINENWYKEKTPIISYIFNEVILDEQLEEKQPIMQTTGGEWLEHSLDELGIKINLPSNFQVYMRGMSQIDPVVIATGMTPAQIDQLLVDGNLYLEATQDDFRSEILVTMIGSTLSDFSTWSDSGLLSMSNMWTSTYQSYGMEILDKDIFFCNGVKYIRMHELQTAADGSIAYKIQYYTTVNYQAINFVFVSNNDEVTESEKVFMQTVVERAEFGADTSILNVGAFAQDPENFTYSLLEDGTACITGYNGLIGTLSIPSFIDGHSVSSIAVMEKNNFVANIYIPDSIVTIDGNPFLNWKTLKSITVSDSHPCFKTINGVLYSHDKLTLFSYPARHVGEDFTVPSHVTKIGKEAFSGAGLLTQVILPEGLMEIGDNAFFGLDLVPSISIPSSVSSIGINPFYGMYELEEIVVASGNKNFAVQQGALYNREGKFLIAFPRKYVTSSFAFRDGIIGIGDYAFWNNASKLDINLPDTVTYIGDSAFSGCGNMTFSDMPISLQTLRPGAFMSTSITKVTIPATIQNIGRACFAACSLTNVTIMPGVTEIAAVMFNDCKMSRIVLPETIRTIGEMAFVNCVELVDINIPSSVTYMGDDVFKNCPKVNVFVVKGSYGETYCRQNSISYQYYEPDLSTSSSMREYTLQAGTFTVTLDESKYNILVPGMQISEAAVIRSGIGADMFESYMSINNKALMMFDIKERLPAEFDISIRIKDKKYADIDLRKCSASEATMMLNQIYTSFESTASNKEIVTINGVPYLKFTWMDKSELRYATIINGDMIYIWATRDNSMVTADDTALLLQVVESVAYPN